MACLASAVTMLLSRPGFAERVVLVRTPKTDMVLRDAFNRMQAELNLQLFEIAVRDACIVEPCPTVSEIAQSEGAAAAVQLQRVGPIVSAQLCIVDRITGEPDLRELSSESNRDAPTVIAIRTVDLLRERLREPLPKARPTTALPAPKAVIAAPTPPPLPQTPSSPPNSLRVGVLGMETASHISPAFGGALTFERRVPRRVRVGLDVMQTAMGAEWRDASGTVTIRHTAVAARASYAWFRREPFEGSFVLGVGMHYLRASAAVRAPLEGRTDTATAWFGFVGVPLSLSMSPHWAVEVEPCAMAMTPRPTIAIAAQQMPYWWLQFRGLIGVRASF